MFRKILLILVLGSSLIGDDNLTNNSNNKFLEKIDILPSKKYIYSVCLDGYKYYVYPGNNMVQAYSLYSGGAQPIKCDNKD